MLWTGCLFTSHPVCVCVSLPVAVAPSVRQTEGAPSSCAHLAPLVLTQPPLSCFLQHACLCPLLPPTQFRWGEVLRADSLLLPSGETAGPTPIPFARGQCQPPIHCCVMAQGCLNSPELLAAGQEGPCCSTHDLYCCCHHCSSDLTDPLPLLPLQGQPRQRVLQESPLLCAEEGERG